MKAAGTLIVALYVIALTGGLLAQPQVRSTVPAGGPNTQYYDNAALRSLPVPIKIRSDMNRGDVIARGNRVDIDRNGLMSEDECQFDFGVEITLMSGSRTVIIERTPDCTVVLQGVVDVDAVEPEAAAEPAAGGRQLGFLPAALRLFGQWWNALSPTLSAQLYLTKGVYGMVYQYGGGGPSYDGLTAQQGWLHWKYNTTHAIMMNASGWYCQAGPYPGCQNPLTMPPMFHTNLGWYPQVPTGFGDVYGGPGAVVTRLDFSTWQYTPTGTWNHTLYARRNGSAQGAGTCSNWYNGSIVLGSVVHCHTYAYP